MKKLLCILWMALFLLSAFGTAAYADALSLDGLLFHPRVLPFLLIGVALIVVAVVIRRMRRKK